MNIPIDPGQSTVHHKAALDTTRSEGDEKSLIMARCLCAYPRERCIKRRQGEGGGLRTGNVGTGVGVVLVWAFPATVRKDIFVVCVCVRVCTFRESTRSSTRKRRLNCFRPRLM